MRSFSDDRAEKSFVEIAKLISEFRVKNQEYTNEELAYGMLQSLTCMDSGQSWENFLNEALNECIHQEAFD